MTINEESIELEQDLIREVLEKKQQTQAYDQNLIVIEKTVD